MNGDLYDDLRDDYCHLVRRVKVAGKRSAPRGLETTEILNVAFSVRDPQRLLPIGCGRKVNTRFAREEALQIVAGVSRPDRLCAIVPRHQDFEDGGYLHGAYGPRLRAQLGLAVDALRRDADSRQAVVVIHRGADDLATPGTANFPCTVSIQFAVRDGLLHTFGSMRSNDVWHGLAYDAYCFAQVGRCVALALGIPQGPYHHHAASLHLYETEYHLVKELHPTAETRPDPDAVLLSPSHYAGCEWSEIAAQARAQIKADD